MYIYDIYIYSYIYMYCIYILVLHSFTDEEACFYISKRGLPTLTCCQAKPFFWALLRPLGFKAHSLTELSAAPDAKSDPSGDNAKLLTSPPWFHRSMGSFLNVGIRWAWLKKRPDEYRIMNIKVIGGI
jgi:hypothetical protein